METQQVVVRPEEGTNHRPQFDIDRGMFRLLSVVGVLNDIS